MTDDWLTAATGRSQTGARARTFDWSTTPLGPAETWPRALRSAVAICFGTRFPTMVAWGPELTMIYNDGYREMLGTEKHPAAWGAPFRDVWDGVWADIGPLVATVMATGRPTWVEDQPLLMERSGFLEETAFTYSYSALRDDDGVVQGILDIAYETTAQVVGGRRMATVTDLSRTLQGIVDPRDLGRAALHRLAASQDVPAAALHLRVGADLVPLDPPSVSRLTPHRSGAAPDATDIADAGYAADPAVVDRAARTGVTQDVGTHGIAVPLAAADDPAAGVVVLHGNPRRPFDEDHRRFLLLLAQTIGTALGTTRRVAREVEESRRIGDALQAAMLPQIPAGPGLQARYRPAGGGMAVGGDWYDVVDLGPGRRALLVGDCVGHGLAAAAVMGQLHSAGRALLLEDTSPAATIESLDRFAATLAGAECTTVFCGIVDTAAGVLTYSSAGHPPPLLIGAHGMQWLDRAVAPPLAVHTGERPQAEVLLAPGDLVLLYTDGLVERRDESLDVGLARLAAAAAGLPAGDLDASTVDALLAAMVPDGSRDDIAVLLHRVGR